MSFALEIDEDDETRKLPFGSDPVGKSFIEIYSELVDEYRISKEDLLYLIDTFLGEDKLGSYAVLTQSILGAADIAYKCVKNGHGIPAGLVNNQMSCAAVWSVNQQLEEINDAIKKKAEKEQEVKS